MKALPFVLFVTLAYAISASAQTSPERVSNVDVFDIGPQKVRVPPPSEFTRIGRRHGRVLSVQKAAEPAQNEIIAVHLPTEQLPKFDADSERQPDFFTKVSASRIGRDEDIKPESFLASVSFIEREFAKLTDPRGREVLAGQYYASKNLSELLDRKTVVKWEQPVNLGVFDKSDRIHSTLTLISVSANNSHYKFLGTVSFVHVNMRVLYVYVYKSNPVEEDLEMIRQFTRNWTSAIVAANEELAARRD